MVCVPLDMSPGYCCGSLLLGGSIGGRFFRPVVCLLISRGTQRVFLQFVYSFSCSLFAVKSNFVFPLKQFNGKGSSPVGKKKKEKKS